MEMRIVAAAFAALITAVPASGTGLENAKSVDLEVRGAIRERCAMGGIGDMNFGNLERHGLSAQARVAFQCNVPFTMTITGQRGALTHTTLPNGQGPYGGAVPYSIAVQVPVRHPTPRTVNRTFDSQQLRAGGTLSSNGGIAADDMVLAVELGRPAGEAGLLAGDYSETITITVSPT